MTGCDAEYAEETVLFERAESAYVAGDYEGATVLYRRFLEIHPVSPLADIAEQRILTIERELDAVMGRRGVPAPVYVSPYRSADHLTGVAPDEMAPNVVAPELPTLER